MRLFSFIFLGLVKIFAYVFYRGKPQWLSEERTESMKDVRLIVLLNHTSLFEPLFIRFAPWSMVWAIAHRLVVPGAEVTMKRPFAGTMLKVLLPGCIPITRQKDNSWKHFLSHINNETITCILPEGRMKRSSGLDKFGRPMSVRGGVADILECMDEGKILFVYSGGLHHIQAPGDKFPSLFKTLKANLELVGIAEYKQQMQENKELSEYKGNKFTKSVIEDMNKRLAERIPA